MSTTTVDPGHPGLWWQGGPVEDEDPDMRRAYAEAFDEIPKPRAVIPSREQILARGRRGGAR